MEVPVSQCIWSNAHLVTLIDHVLYPQKFNSESILAPLPEEWAITIPWRELGHEWAVASFNRAFMPLTDLLDWGHFKRSPLWHLAGLTILSILTLKCFMFLFRCLWGLFLARGPAGLVKAIQGWLPVPGGPRSSSLTTEDLQFVTQAFERMAAALARGQEAFYKSPRRQTTVRAADRPLIQSSLESFRLLVPAIKEDDEDPQVTLARLSLSHLTSLLLPSGPLPGENSELRTIPLKVNILSGEEDLGYINIPLHHD